MCNGQAREVARARLRPGGRCWIPGRLSPQIVGLWDGLLALGYGENEQFVIGVHFT